MTNHEIIHSNDYVDLLVEQTNEIEQMLKSENIYAFHAFSDRFILVHIHKDSLQYFLSQMENQIKYDFPLPIGILDEMVLSVNLVLNMCMYNPICN